MSRRINSYLALLIILLSPMAATAVPISAMGHDFEVETITGDFDSLSALLMSQLWWGDSDLARAVTEVAAPIFPYQPQNGFPGHKPWVAFALVGENVSSWGDWVSNPGVIHLDDLIPRNREQVWLVAEAVAVPEPGTLSLLVAGLLGFGMMRRRRPTA